MGDPCDHSCRILAALGRVSCGACEFRLAKRGRFGGVERATQLYGIRSALEQELQFRKPFRPVVPESLSSRASFYLQRGRLPHIEFHPYAGDDDPRPDCGELAARIPAEHPDEKVVDCWLGGNCSWFG